MPVFTIAIQLRVRDDLYKTIENEAKKQKLSVPKFVLWSTQREIVRQKKKRGEMIRVRLTHEEKSEISAEERGRWLRKHDDAEELERRNRWREREMHRE